MDPERWPQKIRDFVADLVCPRCGEHRHGRKGVFVQVRFMPEAIVWNVQAECWNCSQSWFWNLSPTTPKGVEELMPQEAMAARSIPVVAAEDAGAGLTPLPSWLMKLNDLPPGGSA